MRCIGLDIGSSSIKGGILNLETGAVEHTERAPFPEPVPGLAPGVHEVHGDAVVAGAREILEVLLRRAPDARQLRVSSQMGGVLLLGADGRPLTNYLSWRDQRATRPVAGGTLPLLDEVRATWTDAQFEQLGKELKPGSATTLLHWLARHGQLPEAATPVTIGDHVVAALCQAPARMHPTNAIGLIDLRTGDWHHDAFAAAGIGGLSWPDMADEIEPVGRIATAHGALDGFAAIGDQQAALFGIDLAPSELSINCSTGSQVSRITRGFEPGDCQTRAWFGGAFLNTVTHIPAGRSLSVLEALLTELPRAAGIEVRRWRRSPLRPRLLRQRDGRPRADRGDHDREPHGRKPVLRRVRLHGGQLSRLFAAARRDPVMEPARRVGRTGPGISGAAAPARRALSPADARRARAGRDPPGPAQAGTRRDRPLRRRTTPPSLFIATTSVSSGNPAKPSSRPRPRGARA
jgi:hypothetical protein